MLKQSAGIADVIAVSGDPLEDIRVLENVKFVMKEGLVYKQELDGKMSTTKENR